MIWALEDILGDENDLEFSDPTNPNFRLAAYLQQPAIDIPMAPTITSSDLPVATEAAELEEPIPTPAEVTTDVPDMKIGVKEYDKLLNDAVDDAHQEDYAKAADKAENEGRDFFAIPLEPAEQASEEIESARGQVRSSRRREPMEDDSEEGEDRRRKVPTSTSGPEPYDYSGVQITVITDDMPQDEVDLQEKINLRITEGKMDEQHKKNKLLAKATARKLQILAMKADGQADGGVEAARARARSSRRHAFITMEEKELAEAARRYRIAENTTQEGDMSEKSEVSENDDQVCGEGDAAQEEESEEEKEDEKSDHEDAAEYSGDEGESIIPKQSQVASSSYVATRRSGNITLKFKPPGGAQKPSVGSLEPTPGITESYWGSPMKLNTDDLPPGSDTESEEDDDGGKKEEKEEDDDDNALCSDEESEDDHESLTKILGNPSVPAYLSSKTGVSRRRRGISRPFSDAPQFTPLANHSFAPHPLPTKPPAPFMGFGSYACNTTTAAPPPPPSSIAFDPMKPESNFTFIKPTSITPLAWKPVIPVQKPSTDAASFTPPPWTPWRPVLPMRKTRTNATPSAQVPSTRPGLMTSPPIPAPEVQAYEYVHESRNDSDSEPDAASEANNEVENEAFAFSSDDEQQSNDGDEVEDETFAFSDDEQQSDDGDDDLLADMIGENSEPITEEDQEEMEETFARMTSSDQPSSINHQMADSEPNLVYIWNGPNPAERYYANREMTFGSPLPVQVEESDHDMSDFPNVDNDTDIVDSYLNNNEPEASDEEEASDDKGMVDDEPVQHSCALPSGSAELWKIGTTEMNRRKFNHDNVIEYVHGVIVHPSAPTPPHPNSNVVSEANDTEMTSNIDPISNISQSSDPNVVSTTNDIELLDAAENSANVVSTINDNELSDTEDTANIVIDSNNNEGNVVDSNSNISYRSIVDLDWDNDEPVTPRRSYPMALMDEEVILQYISASPDTGVTDQHVTELAFLLERWSVSESEDLVAATTTVTPTPTPEVGPTTGINPTSPPQYPAASNVTLDPLQQSEPNVSLESSQQLNQDAASISEQEQDTASSHSSFGSELVQTLKEQLQQANKRAEDAKAKTAAEKKKSRQAIRRLRREVVSLRTANAALKHSKKESKQLVKDLLQAAIEKQPAEQSAMNPVEEPVQQPIQPTTEQHSVQHNFMLAILVDPYRVDPVSVQSDSVDPPSADPRMKSKLNQFLGAPCKVNLKSVRRTAKERLESEEAMRRVDLKYKSREQRLREENVEPLTSNITPANVPLPNSDNTSENVVSSTFNIELRDSAAPRTPTLLGLAATLAISFIIPMAVRAFL
jgi:hypothetical protein